MEALALTDHGVLHGAVSFYRACVEAEIHPIIGCEAYVAPGSRLERRPNLQKSEPRAYHLTLLAEDTTGYRNLSQLVSKGFLEGFYYRPRIDRELLSAHKEGLIVLSGCLGGEVATHLINGDFDEALACCQWYLNTFGPDHYYLELMNHGLPRQRTVNEGLLRLSEELGIQLVATNDVHYLNESDASLQDLLLCIQTGKRLDDDDRLRSETDQLYLKSPDQMKEALGQFLPVSVVAQAMANTAVIANRCDFAFDLNTRRLPRFILQPSMESSDHASTLPDEGMSDGNQRLETDEMLRRIAYEGAEARYGSPLPDEVKERLEHELKVIGDTGFPDYFLIVWDLIRFARSQGIRVGPGRGSSASSLVAYALRITDVDPLEHGLLFERFLNPQRVTMPDIDMDFCFERRQEVLEYVVERYGTDRVAQICTFGTLAARAAIRDIGRAKGMAFREVDRVAKLIPEGPQVTVDRAISQSDALRREMETSDEVRTLLERARQVEGTPRHLSIHAAGIVIAPHPLAEELPLCTTSDDATVTQFTGDDLEALGYLKIDLLGLRTLTVIDKAVELINERHPFRLKEIPLDDEKVYDMLCRGEAEGVFQLESSMFQELLKEVRPRNFTDLISILALGRPGPMARLDDYLRHRRGEVKPEYPHPALAQILDETCGIMIYQEQVMRIATELAGYSAGEADLLRRAMGKKEPEIMAQERDRFVEAACRRGLDQSAAQTIFDDVAKFAEYGFPKSHSAAYARVAYETAYLKAHFPAQFMAALMNTMASGSVRLGRYVRECRRLGLAVKGPDINRSRVDFTVEANGIRFGLAAIKNVGRTLAERIITARESGAYTGIDDMCRRLEGAQINRKALESLVRAGAFDEVEDTRAEALTRIDQVLSRWQGGRRDYSPGQATLFDPQEQAVSSSKSHVASELSLEERMSDEAALLGTYISAHPLDPLREVLVPYSFPNGGENEADGRDEAQGSGNQTVAGVLVDVRTVKTRTGGMMAFALLEDAQGRQGELIVFPRQLESGFPIGPGKVVVAYGSLEKEGENVRLVVERWKEVHGSPLIVRVERVDSLKPLRDALFSHQGGQPVILQLEGEGSLSRLALPPRFWTKLDAELNQHLASIDGLFIEE